MTIPILLLNLFFSLAASPILQASFSITGTIRDQAGHSIDSIRVSLLDDNYQSITTVFSYGGRYQFKGLRSGAYFVRVETLGTIYDEQMSQRIEVQSGRLRGGGREEFYFDFVLKFKKGLNKEGAPSVLFTQDVPEAARLQYERGAKSLNDNPEEALAAFKKALEIFPDYFFALEALGTEYARRGEYAAALPILTHAVEINRTASRCLYALGTAYLKLNQLDEAVGWLEKAADQDPQSINVHMMLGIAYGNSHRFDKSEAELQKAYQIGKEAAADAHLYLAGLYNRQNRFADAIKELELYLKEAKNIPDRNKIKTMIDNLKAKEKAKN